MSNGWWEYLGGNGCFPTHTGWRSVYRILLHYTEQRSIWNLPTLPLQFFHLVFLDCRWPWAAKTTKVQLWMKGARYRYKNFMENRIQSKVNFGAFFLIPYINFQNVHFLQTLGNTFLLYKTLSIQLELNKGWFAEGFDCLESALYIRVPLLIPTCC